MFDSIIDVWPEGGALKVCAARRTYSAIGGHGGMSASKKEGDGATPLGVFALRRAFYRADRVKRPETGLPVRALKPDDGWCDDAADPKYNQLVSLPYQGHAEKLWREDSLYDLIIVIGFNDAPVHAGHGSAIFIHCAADNRAPTQGCIAFAPDALYALLKNTGMETKIRIMAAPQK